MRILLSDSKNLKIQDVNISSIVVNEKFLLLEIQDKNYNYETKSLKEGTDILNNIKTISDNDLLYLKVSNFNTSVVKVSKINLIKENKFFETPEKFL